MSIPWACPVCLAPADGNRSGCDACGTAFRCSSDGRPDYRPQAPLTIQLEYRYDPNWGSMPWDIVRLDWPGGAPNDDVPSHWEATERNLLRAIPAATPGSCSLDLGCGLERQRFAEPLGALGYEHVGVDIDGTAPDALADMHLLPFRTACFDLLVTSAVFEHVKQPHVAMAEAARVARPNALFVGTVAFAEPFHISYFHHSPLAVFELLESTGFSVEHLILSTEWNVFQAHLDMGFAGARYPPWLRLAISQTLFGFTLVHAYVKLAIGRGRTPLLQDRLAFARSHSALVGFVATRRSGAAPTFLRRSGSTERDPRP